MCTAICYKGLAGRTLDLEYSFAEEVAITPRGWKRKYIHEGKIATKYALVGMAYMHQGTPLYYDTSSESGLYMAALNFPGYARYHTARADRLNLASAELMPYILGGAGTLAEAREMLSSVNVIPDSVGEGLPVTELHWLLTDGDSSLVIEPRENGLEIIENPHQVLTNAPNLAYHTTKIAEFTQLSPDQPTQIGENPHLYSRGMGAIGLPGDFSSSSRFVRATFLAKNIKNFGTIKPLTSQNNGENSNIFTQISEKTAKNNEISPQNDNNIKISTFFHITDSLTVPYGAVLTDEGRAVYTVYTSCADLTGGVYYFTTYHHRTPRSVTLTPERKFAERILTFSLPDGEKVCEI